MPKKNNENSSNSELVRELIETLEKEAALFETFLELLEQQQKALVENDIIMLNRMTECQREKLIETGNLARKRETIISRLTAEESMTGDLTISKLIESVSPGQANMLEILREMILDLNEKILKTRSQNEMLINRSRENIVKTMELLGRFKVPGNNYGGEGKMNTVQTNIALDRRA
ncbi:MAG: hypothetical protein DRP46_07195 [Candidatus Zixiibacteriota bacterium]|nr:MAG: hypothetical protein DRP46_07195 [candidate division Zixibacteria bacterium]